MPTSKSLAGQLRGFRQHPALPWLIKVYRQLGLVLLAVGRCGGRCQLPHVFCWGCVSSLAGLLPALSPQPGCSWRRLELLVPDTPPRQGLARKSLPFCKKQSWWLFFPLEPSPVSIQSDAQDYLHVMGPHIWSNNSQPITDPPGTRTRPISHPLGLSPALGLPAQWHSPCKYITHPAPYPPTHPTLK